MEGTYYMKRILACCLLLALSLGVAVGCTSEQERIEKETAYAITATVDGKTVEFPVGPYLYYLQSTCDYYRAYYVTMQGESADWAAALAKDDGALSKQLVSMAKDNYMLYLFIETTFDKLGLTLTAEEEAEIDRLIQQDFVSVYGNDKVNSIRQQLRLTYEEFRSLVGINVKSDKIIEHYYGENGVQAISAQTRKDFFKDNYARFKYVVFMTVDEDGNSYTDARIKEIEELAKDASEELEGGAVFEDVMKKYSDDYVEITDKMTISEKELYEEQNKLQLEDGFVIDPSGVFDSTLSQLYGASVDPEIVKKVFGLEMGGTASVKTKGAIWIVKRYDHMEKESYYENVADDVFMELYADDLSAKQTSWTQSLNYKYNEAVLAHYTPETLPDVFDFINTTR